MSADPVSNTAHITRDTPLLPAINAWAYFLKDRGNSPHTIKAFLSDMRLVASFLPPDHRLGDISTVQLNQFLNWLQKGRGVACSPKSYARRITSIKAFFRWLHEHGVILANPAEAVIQHSVISPLPTVLTRDETNEVLKVALAHCTSEKPDHRYYALLDLLLETGIKKSECLSLSVHHIETKSPQGPFVFIRYTNPQYRYKERKIALSEEWISVFRDYEHQYKITDRLFPWSQRRLEYLLEDIGVEAGIDKHLSFDMCRWTCALQDWESGMEHEKIRQKLGVSKIQWREIKIKLEALAKSENPNSITAN